MQPQEISTENKTASGKLSRNFYIYLKEKKNENNTKKRRNGKVDLLQGEWKKYRI